MHATSSTRVGYWYQVRNSQIDNFWAAQHGCGKPNATRVHKPWRMERVTVPGVTVASSAQQVSTDMVDMAPAKARMGIARVAEVLVAETPGETLKQLVQYGRSLPALPDELRTLDSRIIGCTSQVWLTAELRGDGTVGFAGDSDSAVSRGICAVLFDALQGLTPEEVVQVQPESLAVLGLGSTVVTPSRSSGAWNVLEAMKTRARTLADGGAGCTSVFPSLTITADQLIPKGAFADSQAKFLEPDQSMVMRLVEVLKEKKVGIVAHFYMDPEVQGVLTAAAAHWPHIFISDSLVMADRAVQMAAEGCESIAVLGVDFMTENVRAVMDGAGYDNVKVYRLAEEHIGCSLAEAADGELYTKYLETAGANHGSNLHVIYINTSLRTKARGHELVPTITCTSSNVVSTVLQAAAQVPDLNVWYGPDTYMGGNLAELFQRLLRMGDEEIAKLHPEHSTETIRSLLPRLHYFQDGTCVVHHLFGGEVCSMVRAGYSDAYHTAHFEVPGEMFALAMEARERGMGTVGSTKNILDFIGERVKEALAKDYPTNLRFVLGTETGMITSIVNLVQGMLRSAKALSGNDGVSVEVVFPVSIDAISTATTMGQSSNVISELSIVPGPAAGEGCSTSGGCASCPYMKMNTLTSLMHVCSLIGTPAGESTLSAFEPEKYSDLSSDGATIAERGVVPISHMRYFSKTGVLSDSLVNDVISRNAKA